MGLGPRPVQNAFPMGSQDDVHDPATLGTGRAEEEA